MNDTRGQRAEGTVDSIPRVYQCFEVHLERAVNSYEQLLINSYEQLSTVINSHQQLPAVTNSYQQLPTILAPEGLNIKW